MIDMAIFPWRWNLRKAVRHCQDCIETAGSRLSSSWKDMDASRSQSLEIFGAMHGVKLIIAPHITVLAQSANAHAA